MNELDIVKERIKKHQGPELTTEATELLDQVLEQAMMPEELRIKLDTLVNNHGWFSSEYVFRNDKHEAQMAKGEVCRCGEEEKYGPCLIHTVQDHYYRPRDLVAYERDKSPCALCDQPEEAHRHMQEGEYDEAFPVLYDQTFQVGDVWYRVDCRRFWGGPGVTFTLLYDPPGQGDLETRGSGLCFDFGADAVEPLIQHLKRLQEHL